MMKILVKNNGEKILAKTYLYKLHYFQLHKVDQIKGNNVSSPSKIHF
jgi:hypothetical protein